MAPVAGRPPAPEPLPHPVVDNHCHLDMSVGEQLAVPDALAWQVSPEARLVRAPGLRGQLPWRRPEFYADHVVAFLADRPVAPASSAARMEHRP